MYGEIKEVSTVEGTSLTYVLVDFWLTQASHDRGDDPVGDNDFMMELVTTTTRIVTDAQGKLRRADGVFVAREDVVGGEDWTMETVSLDLAKLIRANIQDYLSRRVANPTAFPAWHATPTIQRDQTDPRGVLAKAEVKTLAGTVVPERVGRRLQ